MTIKEVYIFWDWVYPTKYKSFVLEIFLLSLLMSNFTSKLSIILRGQTEWESENLSGKRCNWLKRGKADCRWLTRRPQTGDLGQAHLGESKGRVQSSPRRGGHCWLTRAKFPHRHWSRRSVDPCLNHGIRRPDAPAVTQFDSEKYTIHLKKSISII
jgi:hypothetical protein